MNKKVGIMGARVYSAYSGRGGSAVRAMSALIVMPSNCERVLGTIHYPFWRAKFALYNILTSLRLRTFAFFW